MARSGARWSRRSSSDTATSDTLTNFLNLDTSSQGRSSSGSLPFAEDAIRQNQQDWEHIERIFYGEDALPEDEKTKEEFLDWMESFPYLRLVGKKINTEGFRRSKNPIFHEEIIVQHPTKESNLNLSRLTMVNNNSISGSSRSGHVLTRRFCDCDEMTGQPLKRELDNFSCGPKLLAAESLTARSANVFRLPSVSNFRSKWSSPVDVRPSPLKSTVTLPLLNVEKLTFGDLLTTRSISALHKVNNDRVGGGDSNSRWFNKVERRQ